MIFGKSIAFDREEIDNAAAAARINAFPHADLGFVERLKAGDAEAFDNLVIRFAPQVFGFLCRITEDREEAADLTQETFLSALKAIKSFRGDAELKTWLFRIAINHSRNRNRWWRRRRRDETTSIDAEIAGGPQTIAETLKASGSSPEDDVLRNERRVRIMTAVRDLPDAYRETIILCDIEGLSYEQIAAALEISLGTVKSRLARGREELRRKLNGF